MVRTYVRTTERQKWDENAMNMAVEAVLSSQMGLLKAATQYNVPRSSLERYVKKSKDNPDYKIDKSDGKFKNVFTPEQEEELVSYLKMMESRLFGLTMKELRSLAYDLAEKNGLSHRFNQETRLAGQDWVKGFLGRHPTLSVRSPENTSGARAMGFNKVAVSKFNSLLNEVIDKFKLTPDRIFNSDETGVSVNPKSHTKIIALKGKRQVGSITSAERGETVTAEVCLSASGSYMPPMLIFPRMKKKQEFELGLPPGGWCEVHPSGWMNADLFLVWFRKFIEFSKATKESPVLLILDGHSTHTKNLQLLETARDNGVVLLCLPPHTSHKLQPLDVSFFKPLSLYYAEELRKWLRSNPGKVVTLFQISTIFGAAFVHAATMSTAMNGFKKTGIWPPDLNVFEDADYLPAATTDIQLENNNPLVERSTGNSGQNYDLTTGSAMQSEPPNKKPRQGNSCDEPQPGCSWMQDSPDTIASLQPKSAFQTSPEALIPIPLIKQNIKRTSRKKGKTVIMTESPYKRELQDSIAMKAGKEKKKEKKKGGESFKDAAKETSNKKSLSNTSRCSHKSKKKKEKIEDSESKVDDEECLYCGEFYSVSNEEWIACQKCLKWAHNKCAGVDSDDDDGILVCELCQH